MEEAEQRRIAAEELMEARRRELIEEGGYWKNRMAQDEKTQALQEESTIKAGAQVNPAQTTSAIDVVLLGSIPRRRPVMHSLCAL